MILVWPVAILMIQPVTARTATLVARLAWMPFHVVPAHLTIISEIMSFCALLLARLERILMRRLNPARIVCLSAPHVPMALRAIPAPLTTTSDLAQQSATKPA